MKGERIVFKAEPVFTDHPRFVVYQLPDGGYRIEMQMWLFGSRWKTDSVIGSSKMLSEACEKAASTAAKFYQRLRLLKEVELRSCEVSK